MALTEERNIFIRDIANDEWVDRLPMEQPKREEEFNRLQPIMDAKLKDFLNTTTSAEELHLFVKFYNWDNGSKALMKVISNPACDRNTALWVFWLTGVDLYQEKYANRDDIEDWNSHDRDIWDLFERISENVVNGKYKHANMPADYKQDISEKRKGTLWDIDPAMYGG